MLARSWKCTHFVGHRFHLINTTQRSLKSISLFDLPDKVETYSTRDSGISELENQIPISEKPKSFTCNQFFWKTEGPRTFFVTRKESPQSLQHLIEMSTWIKSNYPNTKLLIEESNIGSLKDGDQLPIYVFPSKQRTELSRVVDIIICLGGDGRYGNMHK